ncbi:MAG TPA: hypothetical protein VGL39_18800 [Jatrophihabitantaceae bacterium]|jgi:photosystem II stability/assembly factor-like uncharacterized protein
MRLRTLVVTVLAFGVVLAAAVPASAHPHRPPSWKLLPTGSTQQFRGLAAVSRDVAWLAGTSGTVLRTSDGGRHWRSVSPPGAAALQFRDIEAWDARHAVALTIGNGTDSRVYRTSDGGASWQVAFTNEDPAAFYDCMAFFNPRDGLAVSDPVDGKFRLIATHDGGRSWAVVSTAGMPAALPGEFGFAASGTCLVTSGHDAWIASGGGASARVFHSGNLGRSWTVVDTPVVVGPSAGIYSLAVSGHRTLTAVGGDYTAPDARVDVAATSQDGGRTWRLASETTGGYRSGVAYVGPRSLVAVGPTGSDVSSDGGRTWTTFDTGYFDTVQRAHDGAVWASGKDGRVAVLAPQ